ncbi:hybrid sensor histidine kinase/response regulator [Dyadobacter luteus]|uniref:histidine kinase n=1 Tax=Dyadobacter luteus TaxID=2259619 RepID=A0A3D8Y2Y5_9BACT|nr:PAS domain-containing hybrid sensor histidine kinase/response regulator [Dyadobacter luteus]REA55973.1 hybrid sensor histidine kinase/response regulator [Dyadobacter luteus]
MNHPTEKLFEKITGDETFINFIRTNAIDGLIYPGNNQSEIYRADPCFQNKLASFGLTPSHILSVIYKSILLAENDAIESLNSHKTFEHLFRFNMEIGKSLSFKGTAITTAEDKSSELIWGISELVYELPSNNADQISDNNCPDPVLTHEELLSVVSNARDVLFIINNDGIFSYITPNWTEFYGHNIKDSIGKSFIEYIHPDDLDLCLQTLQYVVQTGETLPGVEHRILHSDGGWSWSITTAKIDTNTNNIILTSHDITQLKKSREQMHELALVASSTRDLIVIADETGRITWINEAFKKRTRKSDTDIHGKNLMILFDNSHNKQEVLIRLHSIFEKEEILTDEIILLTQDGDKFWADLTLTPVFNNKGERTNLIAVCRDISVRKRSEYELQRTREILEQTNRVAKIGGWRYDLESQEVFWTPALKQLHEVEQDYIPTLESAMSFYRPGEQTARLKAALAACIEHGTSYDLELEIITKNNNVIWMRTIGAAVFVNGKCVRVYGSSQDITEHKIFELQLSHARKNAEAASKSKSEFLANMSHEIRTPLNGIIGFTDLLIKTQLDAPQQQYISMVQQSATALLDIINDILDFSKIEAGKLELLHEKTDLLDLCGQVTDLITFQAHQKNLEILLDISADVPHFVYTDKIRLKQILLNLMSNAVKFTINGEIELKVVVLASDNPKQWNFRFSVRDTGIGIEVHNQKRIFEAFAQEDSSTTKRFGGTGLGISISNNLLGLMNSSLQLQSVPGIGSEFFFDVILEPSNSCSRLKWAHQDKINRVMIIDKNQRNGQIISDMLRHKEIASDYFTDFNEALAKVNSGMHYDAILLDFSHDGTGKNKEENFESIVQRCQNIAPVILLNRPSEVNLQMPANELTTPTSRLLKPVKIQQLFAILGEIAEAKNDTLIKNRSFTEHTTSSSHQPEKKAMTILIAEDHMINMLLIKTMLTKINPDYRIIEAKNGLEAVAAFEKNKPDLILMDIQMPDMNGYEASAAIRKMKNGTHVPIIAVTAGTVKGERERCIDSGMNDYLSKPVLKEILEECIKTWLH